MRPGKQIYLLAVVLSAIVATVIWVLPVSAQKAASGRLIGLKGQVQVCPSPGEASRPAVLLDPVLPGTALHTGEGGKAKIFFPPDVVLILDPHTSIALEAETAPSRAPGQITVKVRTGNLHFLVNSGSYRSGGRLQLLSPTAFVEARDVKGLLSIGPPDRVICLTGGSGLSIKNRVSDQHRLLKPLQMANSSADGTLEIASLEIYQVEQFSVNPGIALLPPPPAVLQPPTPARSPITLAEQVKQPWPVLPPVLQVPNLWIKEIYGPLGRQIRPNPRP